MNSIIQWNMQSYHTHFNDLKLIFHEHAPACVCLQETLLRNRTYQPSGYHLLTSRPTRVDGHERGAALLINDTIFIIQYSWIQTFKQLPLEYT